MRFIIDLEKNFLTHDKILKWIAFGLRNYREKDQELPGHPPGMLSLEPDGSGWNQIQAPGDT